jgi:hypothetical protein
MTKNNKGRSGGDRPTPKTTDSRNPTLIHSSIKAAIVRLAVWGLIPVSFATWLIQRGGLRDA